VQVGGTYWRGDTRTRRHAVVSVEAAGGCCAAEDSGFVGVAGVPGCEFGCVGDVPVGDEAFADAAVFTDRGKVSEDLADGVGVSDGAPGQRGGGMGHDGDVAFLVAAAVLGHRGPTDGGGELLEALAVGS
jgi:hypothetical protein